MKVTAKCHNYSGCLLAYRGEPIEIEEGAALICPECGKPVKLAPKSAIPPKSLMIGGAALIGVVVIALIAASSIFSGKKEATPHADNATPAPEPAQVDEAKPQPEPPKATPPVVENNIAKPAATPAKSPPPATPAPPAPEPVAAISAPAKIDLSPENSENKQVRAEVLARVDVMPNISPRNKDRLYASVQRARSLGKVLTIPFASGKTTLSAAEIVALKEQVDSPAILKIRDDPTSVFVVLGYADPKGDTQKNLDYSQARADAVVAAMRDKCGVVNVTHAVAMGASTLLDSKNLDKNRTVEVWAVLP